MELKVVHNEAIELVCALIKYSGLKFEKIMRTGAYDPEHRLPLDFTPTPEVKEWLKTIDAQISVFQKNDIEFITEKISGVFYLLIRLIVKHRLDSAPSLLALISNINPSNLIAELYESYQLNLPLNSEQESLRQALEKEISSESTDLFLKMKQHPKDFQRKLLDLLQLFWEIGYKPFLTQIEQSVQKQLQVHNQLLEQDPLRFLNIIGLGDYTNVIEKHQQIRLFISYFVDLGMQNCFAEGVLCFVYGSSMEKRFNQNLLREKCQGLFKALSDERRLEIIRLTSTRAWYNKELADYFGLSTATLSYHLNLLLDLRILDFVTISNRIYYSTNKQNLKDMFAVALEELLHE